MKTLLILVLISASLLTAYGEPEASERKEVKEADQGIIGILFLSDPKAVIIHDVIEGSPAFLAGLKKGDLITRVDDRPVEGMEMEDQLDLLRGEVGSKVDITVLRLEPKKELIIQLVRASKQKLLQLHEQKLSDKPEIAEPEKPSE